LPEDGGFEDGNFDRGGKIRSYMKKIEKKDCKDWIIARKEIIEISYSTRAGKREKQA